MTTVIGKTKLDKIAEENQVCRMIVKEVLNYGLSQRQIYMILYLMSLELENVEHLQDLTAVIREMKEDTHLIEHPADVYKEKTGDDNG
jgi:hypothetical protein